ncbi:MAG: hypothetical protein GEU93_08805 [Propionibacteriales bacterium]|nr:hypothetical protein [Propionibacteriales bacterium]
MAVMGENRARLARAIGTWGTAARLLVGGFLAGSVVLGSFTGGGTFEPEAWLLGLVVFPAVILGGQAWRAHRSPDRLVALSGPVGHPFTAAVFLVLYGTTWYAPPIGFVSDAALLFYGGSMLLSAYRGYAGCEVLAISNWLLRRDDQVGCVLFDPVDRFEGRQLTSPRS